jgi:uncharacterized protein (DUF1800 family)
MMSLERSTLLRLQRLAPLWRNAGALVGIAALMSACGGGSGTSDSTSSNAAAPVSAPGTAADAGTGTATTASSTVATTSPPATGTSTSTATASTSTTTTTTTAPTPVAAPVAPVVTATPAPPAAPMSTRDAVRLADQATFGPTEALVATIKTQGIDAWLSAQFTQTGSQYTSGNGSAVDQYTGSGNFCDGKATTCWRDWSSTEPNVWDFYRNAVTQPDQLRQRVAFALQQIVVVSGVSVSGTYGFRSYYNALLANAFGNYRQVLKKVALSPLMGDFLNNANNDKAAPNENFGRELLQLFSIGTCALNNDGSLAGGTCTATYTNDIVRNYAFALTGWTYPAGGATPWGCWPTGMNCRFYDGDMIPVASYHDTTARTLLSGVSIAANTAAAPAMESVLDSLMAHPNIGPFIGKQLIQHLVGSNPSPAYVARVATAFNTGKYLTWGTGAKGDLTATVAAILLDAEARGDTVTRSSGKLREPAQMMAGVLRALNGKTDGASLTWWWGSTLNQFVTRPPSVFNFFPPDNPVPGTGLLGPEFAIHGDNAALDRLNFLTYLLDWNGSTPDTTVPNAIGTSVDLSAFTADAATPATLVDRLSLLAFGQPLATAPRQKVIDAVSYLTSSTDGTNWTKDRVKTAAYLVFASPNYQVIR